MFFTILKEVKTEASGAKVKTGKPQEKATVLTGKKRRDGNKKEAMNTGQGRLVT